MVNVQTTAFVVTLLIPVLACAEPCDRFVTDQEPGDDAASFAATVHELAVEASAAGCLDQADRLLEGAHHADADAWHIYARILVREQMGDARFALELLDGYRDELAAHPDVHDLVAIDRRLREKLRDSSPLHGAESGVPERRTTLDTLGPILVGAVGLGALGFSIYGLTASCALEAADGSCLRGSTTALGPTVGYAVLGVAALSGASLWWAWTSPRHSAEVALSPGSLRARF